MIANVFIGSSAYALPALNLLCEQGHKPLLVISQPDKPAGRNLHPTPTPVSEYAREHDLPLITPENINTQVELLAGLHPELLITASYGGWLGSQLRHLAIGKAINLHPSLLPKYRGASPIQSALLAGETETGTTIFRLTAAMDAGPVIAQEKLTILDNENYSSLHERLALQAAELLSNLISKAALPFPETPQAESPVSHCAKIDSELCQIDWSKPAKLIQDQIRAFSELPGAWTYFRGGKLKLLSALPLAETTVGEPGTIGALQKNTGFTVNCRDFQLLVTQVQQAGKKTISAAAFMNGARLESGEKLWK